MSLSKIIGPFSKATILKPVQSGAVSGTPINAENLFKSPSIVFVVRRPG